MCFLFSFFINSSNKRANNKGVAIEVIVINNQLKYQITQGKKNKN